MTRPASGQMDETSAKPITLGMISRFVGASPFRKGNMGVGREREMR